MSSRVEEIKDRMAKPLKPCPYCGGKPKALGGHVYCEECCAATTIFLTQREACDAWDRRTNEPADEFVVSSLFDDDEAKPARTYVVRR